MLQGGTEQHKKKRNEREGSDKHNWQCDVLFSGTSSILDAPEDGSFFTGPDELLYTSTFYPTFTLAGSYHAMTTEEVALVF